MFSKSAVYTRWGKKMCPPSARLVYSGFTGGSWYGSSGAAVEPLCLPRNPQWGIYEDGIHGERQYIYGAEYETSSLHDRRKKLHDHDVPCAVCSVRGKSAIQMIPETLLQRLDKTLHGGYIDKNGRLFYPVEGRCGSLKCPPYVEGRELTYVVCSAV